MVIEQPSTSGTAKKTEIPPLWVKTPLIYSHAMSQRAGYKVYLKLDLHQPSGSFKSRGIGNLVLTTHRLHPTTPLHFFSSSGGNAGLACIVASRTLGHPCTVICPTTTSVHMVNLLRRAGGTIIQHGESWMEADAECRRLLALASSGREKGVYVPPFDHPLIWEGNTTLGTEIREQLGRDPDAVVLSVGGGGMLIGASRGLDRGRTEIVAVETVGADSMASSVEAGVVVTLERVTSIAKTLGARRVCEEAFRVVGEGGVRCVRVSDGEAAMGCWRLAQEERICVEASCGASAAAVYNGRVGELLGEGLEEKVVVLVICGGSDVNLEVLEEWRAEYQHLVPWMQELHVKV